MGDTRCDFRSMESFTGAPRRGARDLESKPFRKPVAQGTGEVCVVEKQPPHALLEVCPRGVTITAACQTAAKKVEDMRPKKIILCIDDNEQALSVRKFLLETRGYRVLSALTAEEAMEFFDRGGIDLVICDLVMPHTDGNELVRRMKERAPEVPAMLVSGAVHNFDRATAADAFLPKGACSPLEILERVRIMVARKRGPRKHVPRPELNPQVGQAVSAVRQVAAS